MLCFKLLLVSLCVGSTSLHAAKCARPLAEPGKRPNKKTLGPGATLVVKSKLVRAELGPNGNTVYGPIDVIKAYAPDVPFYSKISYPLEPGRQLRTLTGHKHEGPVKVVRVELVPGGEKAVMYWTDIYYNTLVTHDGEPVPAKPASTRQKFPNKRQSDKVEELWAEGQTAWGRPKAEIGQTVWAANHTRTMGRGSVGILKSTDAQGGAEVETLTGKVIPAWHRDCVPLTSEEITWF